MLAQVALDRGDVAAAEERGEASLAIGRASESLSIIANAQATLGRAALARGDPVRARALLEACLQYKLTPSTLSVLAEAEHALGLVAWQQGRAAEAAARLRQGLASRWRRREWAGIAGSLEGLAMVAADTSEPVRAARWLGAADHLRETFTTPCAPIDRPALDHLIASLLAAMGDGAFAAALAVGRAQPTEQAVADALAAFPDEPAAARPATGVASPAGDGLSAREREVAEHVAAGLTNRQIAAALAISVRTVDRHVENTLGKLGLTTRSQIAAWVTAQAR
jgi:non-specific serine/threonine protein kinase